MKVQVLTVSLIALLGVVSLSGCGSNQSRINTSDRPYVTTATFNKEVSERTVRTSKAVAGVKNATAIANGNILVIGLDLKKGTDPTTVTQRVHDTVLKKEAPFAVHVTADPALTSRIRTAYTRVTHPTRGDKPARDLTLTVAEIVHDIDASK